MLCGDQISEGALEWSTGIGRGLIDYVSKWNGGREGGGMEQADILNST